MKNNKTKIYITALIVVALDQLVKLLVKTNFKLHEELELIPSFFSLHYLENDGAAFSILQDKTYLLILVALICLIFMIYYIQKEKSFSKLSSISTGLILGGITGNLLDRIFYKKVIDFLSFTFFTYSFPVFNIADIGITVGVVLLLIYYFLEEKNESRKNQIKEN